MSPEIIQYNIYIFGGKKAKREKSDKSPYQNVYCYAT